MRRSFDLFRSPNFLSSPSKRSVSDSPAGIFDEDDFVISIIIIFTKPGERRVGLRNQFKFRKRCHLTHQRTALVSYGEISTATDFILPDIIIVEARIYGNCPGAQRKPGRLS